MTGKIIQFPSLDDSEAAERISNETQAFKSLDQWILWELNKGTPAKAIAIAIKHAYQKLEEPPEDGKPA